MKTFLKIFVILVVAIVAYNYFKGTPEEKASSELIIKEVKDVGKAVQDLLKEEHTKYKEGKYDKIFDDLKDLYSRLESSISQSNPEMLTKLDELKEKAVSLENEIGADSSLTEEEIKKKIDELLNETRELAE